MAASALPPHPLLAIILFVGFAAANNSSLAPKETIYSNLQAQENETHQLAPATPLPPIEAAIANYESQFSFPQQSLDPICAETIRENLLQFLKRAPQLRQDEDDDDEQPPGLLQSIQQFGQTLGLLPPESTTIDPLLGLVPNVANGLQQITAAFNQQLNSTAPETPNLPSFLLKQGQNLLIALIANQEANNIARMRTRTSTTVKTIQEFPAVDTIRHSTTTTTTTLAPKTEPPSKEPQVEEQRASAEQFISELLTFLRANVSSVTTSKPQPRLPPTTKPPPTTTTTTQSTTQPTTTPVTTTTTTTRRSTTKQPLTTDDVKVSSSGGKPIFWMNMFYPFGIPTLPQTVTASTTTTTTMKPRRRRRRTTTTLPPSTSTTQNPEWEYYDEGL